MKRFLGVAHHHVCSNTANDHMIAELAESRIGTNVPRRFPRMRRGVWEQDYRPRDKTIMFKVNAAI